MHTEIGAFIQFRGLHPIVICFKNDVEMWYERSMIVCVFIMSMMQNECSNMLCAVYPNFNLNK